MLVVARPVVARLVAARLVAAEVSAPPIVVRGGRGDVLR